MTTTEVLFDRKEDVPDEPKLKKALGDVYPVYKELLALTETYQREWKFYGPKIGWQFKVTHKGKALFYLTPQDGSFRLGLAVRDKEKEVLLKSKLPAKAKEELVAAKRYPEGWPLHLHVNKQSDMKAVRLVVDTLKALRP
ncbi:MAG: DUF3788 family protein [Ignavibacteriales bacterium]|nr:DUF3788 family protein [Ignavibacteriales bacterium]